VIKKLDFGKGHVIKAFFKSVAPKIDGKKWRYHSVMMFNFYFF